jgi:hypothetical protein
MCESIMDKVKNLGFGGASGLARTEFAQIAISTPWYAAKRNRPRPLFRRFDTPARIRRIGTVDRDQTKEGGQHEKISKSTNALSFSASIWWSLAKQVPCAAHQVVRSWGG